MKSTERPFSSSPASGPSTSSGKYDPPKPAGRNAAVWLGNALSCACPEMSTFMSRLVKLNLVRRRIIFFADKTNPAPNDRHPLSCRHPHRRPHLRRQRLRAQPQEPPAGVPAQGGDADRLSFDTTQRGRRHRRHAAGHYPRPGARGQHHPNRPEPVADRAFCSGAQVSSRGRRRCWTN